MFTKSEKVAHRTVAFLVILFLGLLIYMREKLLINVLNLPFDDGLFIGRAEALIGDTEKTLGSTRGFNPLVKGQIYPFILEISNFLSLNPLVMVYIIFLITTVLSFIIFYKKIDNILFIIPFTLLVFFDPSPFSSQASRISREFFYGTTILVIFLIITKLRSVYSLDSAKLRNSLILLMGSSLGLVVFLANNTREERIWIYLICASGLIWVTGKNKEIIKSSMSVLALAIIVYSILIYSLKNYNEDIFGVRLTSTTVEGEFPKLMSNLASIEVSETFNPYVSISESKRKVAYQNSQSFSLLRPYLEGEGKAWIQFGCDNSKTCGDYANGWFHVALRIAIDDLGYWTTQENAQDFMQKVNTELSTACKSGRVNCSRPLPLAKALGVTKITGAQIATSINFLKLYMAKSIFGWNLREEEFSAYTVMEESQWARWKFVIKSLPDSQEQYQNQFNHRINIFNSIYKIWVTIHVYIKLIAILLSFSLIFRLIFYGIKFNKKESYLLYIGFYSLFIWITRGVLLAMNSATNLISISQHYSLPGNIFLTIALSIFSYFGAKNIYDTKYKK